MGGKDDYDSGTGGGGTSSGGGWGDPGGVLGHIRNRNSDALDKILDALPPNIRENGVQIDEFHWADPATGTVYELATDAKGAPSFKILSDADSKRFLGSVGSGSGGSSGSGTRLASDDPRYWANQDREFALEVQKLQASLMNTGMDAESARRQALTTLITNRNNTAVDVANTSASVAKTAAEFAANPRDAVAELMYRNQVGGSTPFGDLTNDNFGAYGKALADKAASIFQPVAGDIAQARVFRDSIPPVDFFGPETRDQLGLPPTPAQSLTGGTQTAAPPAAAAPVNGLQALMDRLNSMSEQEKTDFRKWTTAGKPAAAAHGAKLDFESIFSGRDKDGFSPSSSEGGTNLNIHERALVVGESGQVYATLGEKRPDGSMRSESLQIKPLKSEVEKDKKLAEGEKAVVESQKKTLAAFDQGGTVTSTPDDFMEQLRQYLGSLGGSGGGAGPTSTPLQSPRLLAGAPWDALLEDPDAMAYTQAGFSALGISPDSLAATLKKFTPKSAQLIGQTAPRVSFG